MKPAIGAVRRMLASKLHCPASSPSQIIRTRVRDLVCAAKSVKVVLVRAPAGFGKSTMMLQCRAELMANGVDTAWLTLDAGDNDAARFLHCLDAAVTQITGGAARAANECALAPGDMALDIMARLTAHPSPFALLLDDFEYVRDPTVLELVRELIGNLPRAGQLIIGARSRPELGLARLRAHGQLLEIDAEQLRFSSEETAQFFTSGRQMPLPDDELASLHRKTEGWAAAIWLASIALERRADRSEFIARFSGTDEGIADYLLEDVLARQPDTIRHFLLRTSILHHMNAALCDAMLGATDSAAMLARLEAANLFLQPIEGGEKSWRYHSLFASFLRQQAAQTLGDQLPALHRAASAWYEAQSRPVPAIDHALEGGNLTHALALLTKYGEQLLEEGRTRLLARWFAAIPVEQLRDRPPLQVIHIWAVSITRGPWEALPLLEASGCAESPDASVRAQVLALRPALYVMTDQFEQASQAGAEAMLSLHLMRPFAESVLINSMALIHCSMGRREQAHQLLDTARHRRGNASQYFHRMYSESIEGIIDMEEGRLRQATARFRLAVNSTHVASYTYANGNAFAGVLYADALYEVNDLKVASHLLNIYVPLIKDSCVVDHIIIGYLRLARIAYSLGDIDLVLQRLSELEYIGYQRELPRVVASATLERSRLYLMQGNRKAAHDELRRADDTAVWDIVRASRMSAHDLEYIDIGKIRWEIHFGDAGLALLRLEREIALSEAAGRQRRLLQLQLLKSLALQQANQPLQALKQLDDMLRTACREGFQRLIIDEGELAGVLVRQRHLSWRSESEAQQDPLFADYVQQLLKGFPAADADDSPTTGPPGGTIDVLTQKEARILELLAEGYSNGALAEKLFISTSTVRTHLRNVYGKLGAESRTQAVAIARRLGMVS